MKPLFPILIVIPFLLSCAKHAPLAPGTNESWKAFDRGNIVTSEWRGEGCENEIQNSTIHLVAKKGKTSTCSSTPLGTVPGHYEFTVWIKTKDLALAPQRYLNEALLIRLRLFDHSGVEIDPTVNYLGQRIDGQDLSYSFNRVQSDKQIEELGFTKVHLVPRFYPYDSGWLPDEVGSVGIEASLHGPGEVWLKNFDLRYSKWNFGLRERIQHLSHFKDSQATQSQSFSLRIASGRDVRRTHYQQEIESGAWLPKQGFNALFIDAETSGRGWWPLNREAVAAIEQLKDRPLTTGILINPYLQFDAQGKGSFEFSNQEQLDRLFEVLGAFQNAGMRQVILRFDDFSPHLLGKKFGYYLGNKKDRKKFGTLARAHAHVVQLVQQKFPKLKLYVVPPWYNNIFCDLSEGLGPRYLKELSALISKNVDIMWTGPTVRSLFIDEIHVKRFSDWIGGRVPVLWDNTLYARRANDFWAQSSTRSHLTSEIEPYSVEIPYYPEAVYINAHVTELYRIQLATAGEYFANSRSYNQEAALWNYLKRRFGAEAAELILEFDEKVAMSKETKLIGKSTEEIEQAVQEKYQILERSLGQHDATLLDELKSSMSFLP